jgi:serine/threonine protein kinase
VSLEREAQMKYCELCGNNYPDDIIVCPQDGTTVRRSDAQSDPFVGRVIRGRYRVERQLGEGAMGTVYLAEQLSVRRKVALKILRADFARDENFVARFQQEARLVAALNETRNSHVTLVHDFEQADDGSFFIVMEWLEGRVLSEVIAREGALGLSRALRLATQIAEGLDAAHSADVIHRDVKPHNITGGPWLRARSTRRSRSRTGTTVSFSSCAPDLSSASQNRRR